jgi:NADPH2:quinone reductase
VFIHAVAGGVGTAAVEMGKVLGLEIFGTSSSEEKLQRVKQLGLNHGINYKQNDYEKAVADLTHGEGVDAVFEMLGGEHTAKSTRCLADMGRIIIYGMATGQAPQFDFMAMFQKNISAHALWLTPLTAHRDLMVQAWTSMSVWIAQGLMRPVVGAQLPLERAADAHRLLLERKNYGKVVLTL